MTEGQAKTLFRTRARNLLPLFARQPLDFAVTDKAELSVVMVLHNQFEFTMQALSSLRQNWPGPIELVLVDSGSSDETRFIDRYVRGASLLRFDVNLGFVRGCNAGLTRVTSDAVLLLNNDVELGTRRYRRSAAAPRLGSAHRYRRRQDHPHPWPAPGGWLHPLARRRIARLHARCVAAGARGQLRARRRLLLWRLPHDPWRGAGETGGPLRRIHARVL